MEDKKFKEEMFQLGFCSICFILIMCMVGSVNASSDGLIYKAYQPIEMKTSCIINGTYCSSSSVCNITIIYPQTGGVYINNKRLQNQINFYNLTLPSTNILGEYNAKVVCFDPTIGLSGSQDFTFKVTSTGTTGNGNMTIFIFLLSASVIILIISLVLSNAGLGTLSGFSFILSGMYNNVYGIGIEQNMYTTGIGMIIVTVGLIIMFVAGYNYLGTFNSGFTFSKNKEEDDNDIFNYTQEKEDSE